MFTGFDFGINVSQIMTDLTALLSNPLVATLLAGTAALTLVPWILLLPRLIFEGRWQAAQMLEHHFNPYDKDNGDAWDKEYGTGDSWDQRAFSRLTDFRGKPRNRFSDWFFDEHDD